MYRQYDTIVTGGCPGSGGGVCIVVHQDHADKKNPSGFFESPESVMITIKGFPMKITLEDMMGADAPIPPL
jgi:hypothetical protein